MKTLNLSQDEQKGLVGKFAVDFLIERGMIFSGMKIGLGTGSTAMPAVRRLAERIFDGAVSNICAVATSFQTTIECQKLKIPVFSMNAPEICGSLDLAIDGADEISARGELIKGGGAALLLEKIVAYNAKKFVVVADESKFAPKLGAKFPLPVEILPEARVSAQNALERLGASCVLRMGLKKAGPVVTDSGNLILDCLWKAPPDCAEMELAINQIPGVIENGFFARCSPMVFKSHSDGTVESLTFDLQAF